MTNHLLLYKGLFLNEQSKNRLRQHEGINRLEQSIPFEHITFEFRPSCLFPAELVGKRYELKVIAYGNDGTNSGFKVELPKEIHPYYHGHEVIHVTSSISLNGKPKETALLPFRAISPFIISGQLGYMINAKGNPTYSNPYE